MEPTTIVLILSVAALPPLIVGVPTAQSYLRGGFKNTPKSLLLAGLANLLLSITLGPVICTASIAAGGHSDAIIGTFMFTIYSIAVGTASIVSGAVIKLAYQ